MNCKKAEEYLIDYLYQELAAKKTLEIEKHLRGCTHCTSTLESWRAIHRAYQRTTEEPQIAPYTKQKILVAAEQELNKPAPWSEKFVWALKIATVPIAIFVIVLFLNSQKENDMVMTQPEQLATPSTVVTEEPPAGQKPSAPAEAYRQEPAPARTNETIKGERELEKTGFDQASKRKEDSFRDSEDKKREAEGMASDYPAAAAPAPPSFAPQKEELRAQSESDSFAEQRTEPSVQQRKASKISSVTSNVDEPYEKAQYDIKNKNLARGVGLLKDAIRNDSQGTLAGKLHQEGVSYQNKGEYGNAIVQYKQVQDSYKDYPRIDEVLLNLGDSYAEIGDFSNAVKAYAQVSTGRRKVAEERIQRLQKKQEAQQQLKSLGYVGDKD